MHRFIRELRRREVFRTAGLYVGVCWIIIEVSSVLLPTFEAPEWAMRAIIIAAFVGFPIMLVLAWIYDVSAKGIEVQGDPTDTVVPPLGSRRMDFIVIGVLSVALVLSLYMNITGGPKSGAVLLLLSPFPASLDLGHLGHLGIEPLALIPLVVPTDVTGSATIPYKVAPGLAGISVFQQAFYQDLSNGLAVRFR